MMTSGPGSRLVGVLVSGALLLSVLAPATAATASPKSPARGTSSSTSTSEASAATTTDDAAIGAVRMWTSTGSTPDSWHVPLADGAWTATRDRGVVLQVDTGHRHQPIHGVGAALTESSAHLLRRLPAAERDRLLRSLFLPGEGMGFSVVRVPLGASDFSLQHGPTSGTYEDTPGAFTLARAADVVAVLREIRALRPDVRIMAAPWSPPAWAKTSSSLYHGGLRPDAHASYAAVLLRTVDAFAAAGVPIDALSLQNEPRHEPWDYPGARIPATDLARLARTIGPDLDRRGIELVGLDHNFEDVPHALTLLDEAAGAVDAIAFHCYAGNADLASLLQDVHPGTPVDMTECSSGAWSQDANANLRWAVRELLVGAGRIGARSTVTWNLALDPSHGPRQGGCTNCTGVTTIDLSTATHRLNHDAYAFGHLGRFLPAGSHRATSTSSPSHGLHTLAASRDGRDHTLLLVNDGGGAQTVTLRWGTRRLALSAPARSVTTLRWQGRQDGPAVPAAPTGVVARPVRDGVAVDWTFATGSNGYVVERAATSRGPWTAVARVDVPGWQDRTLAPGTSATYRVRAVGSGGTSAASGSVSGTRRDRRAVGTTVEAESFDAQRGVTFVPCTAGGACRAIGNLVPGHHATYRRVDLQGGVHVRLQVATSAASRVRLTTTDGHTLATVDLPDTGEQWTTVTAGLGAGPATADVVVSADRGRVRLDWWRVER